ncbi:MAG: KpsF/GutQ family sugar-phosphate isomerase [Rikenellaceae bacterium]
MKKNFDVKLFACEVIRKEVEAIDFLKNFIDDTFVNVINILYNSKGRVILTGIGKSAIIANKIVATLNSTGTPALFMHAADAIHGDLGMIQRDDVIICISKSGNTPEIKVLIPLIRNLKYDNVIVGMVGNDHSYLAQNCDHIVNSYVDHEACPNNLAPTSSTTAQLVMGDAIAMSLLKMRGLTADDFAKIHPGGALGKQLYVRVIDLVDAENIPSVSPDATLEEVIIEISCRRLGATAVIDKNGVLCGIITDGDLRRMLQKRHDIDNVKASEIMTKTPYTIDPEELAIHAFTIMEKRKITQLLVADENKNYKGIIHIHAILNEGVI